MIKHYQSYYWKKGKPYGRDKIEDPTTSLLSYKIVPDPYYRRFSIEKYKKGKFEKIVYDSFLFDFRHLKPEEQAAWQKELIEENNETTRCLLRNQDDRAVLFETYSFHNDHCRSCMIYSIHGLYVAKNCMYYCHLGDSFNGVVLYDSENQPVMMKTYTFDLTSGEFSNLLSEEWDMSILPTELSKIIDRMEANEAGVQ